MNSARASAPHGETIERERTTVWATRDHARKGALIGYLPLLHGSSWVRVERSGNHTVLRERAPQRPRGRQVRSRRTRAPGGRSIGLEPDDHGPRPRSVVWVQVGIRGGGAPKKSSPYRPCAGPCDSFARDRGISPQPANHGSHREHCYSVVVPGVSRTRFFYRKAGAGEWERTSARGAGARARFGPCSYRGRRGGACVGWRRRGRAPYGGFAPPMRTCVGQTPRRAWRVGAADDASPGSRPTPSPPVPPLARRSGTRSSVRGSPAAAPAPRARRSRAP